MHGLDAGAYYFFRSQAGELPLLTEVMRVIHWLGSPAVMTGVIAVALATQLARGERRAAVVTLAFALGGYLCVVGLAWGLQQAGAGARPPEPDIALPNIFESPGFPSRAAFMTLLGCGLLASSLGRYCPGSKSRLALYAVFGVFVLLHGFSELFLRVHFVSDLLGGWNAGVLVMLMCVYFSPES